MWKAKCNVFLSVSRYKERLSVRVITYIEQLQKVKKKKNIHGSISIVFRQSGKGTNMESTNSTMDLAYSCEY